MYDDKCDVRVENTMSGTAIGTAPFAPIVKASRTFCDLFRDPIPPSVVVYSCDTTMSGQMRCLHG